MRSALVTGPLGPITAGFVVRDASRFATAHADGRPAPARMADRQVVSLAPWGATFLFGQLSSSRLTTLALGEMLAKFFLEKYRRGFEPAQMAASHEYD
jgi:hypothetical protein